MKADAQTEAAVIDVMQRFMQAYKARNLDDIMALLAPDPDLVLIGTGADERRVGLAEARAQTERDWAQSDEIALSLGWHMVSAAGPVAWLAADIAFQGTVDGQHFALPGRMTAVLENRDGNWLIVQSHFSAPFGEQAEGESFPTE